MILLLASLLVLNATATGALVGHASVGLFIGLGFAVFTIAASPRP